MIKDFIREIKIKWLCYKFLNETDIENKTKLYKKMAKEIFSRSPRQVAKMEKTKGLI